MKSPEISGRTVEEGGRPLVLFALEPRSYSEAIGKTVAALRPDFDILVVEPEELVAEMERRVPALVFCGGPRPEHCDEAVRWARFRPYDEPDVVRVDGVAERFPGIDVEVLLGLVDRALAGQGRRTPSW